MSKGSLINIDVSGLRRLSQTISDTPKRVERNRNRAISTLQRRLKSEAARKISELQLNLSARQISPYINVKASSAGVLDYVSVYASNKRLPIKYFKPKRVRGHGILVTTWRGEGQRSMPHAFMYGGNWWQRVPYRAGMSSEVGPSGLVWRLPITARVGPSLKRALQPVSKFSDAPNRDVVIESLKQFGMQILRAEIARLSGVM